MSALYCSLDVRTSVLHHPRDVTSVLYLLTGSKGCTVLYHSLNAKTGVLYHPHGMTTSVLYCSLDVDASVLYHSWDMMGVLHHSRNVTTSVLYCSLDLGMGVQLPMFLTVRTRNHGLCIKCTAGFLMGS